MPRCLFCSHTGLVPVGGTGGSKADASPLDVLAPPLAWDVFGVLEVDDAAPDDSLWLQGRPCGLPVDFLISGK